MSIRNADTFHVGIKVPDLDLAMAEYASGLDVTWAAVQEREQPIWQPHTGLVGVPLRFTYSCEGPVHLELLQGTAGSFWDGVAEPGLHHTGVWSDDVRGDTKAFVDAGWTLVGAGAAPEDGFGVFTYVQAPTGLIVELVWSAVKPRFEAWWAGGTLG
jgi:hypothetical protein